MNLPGPLHHIPGGDDRHFDKAVAGCGTFKAADPWSDGAAMLTEGGIRVRFLGSGASSWKPEWAKKNPHMRRQSSVLIENKVLIDFTMCSFDHLPKNCHPEVLFQTHSHGDHYNPFAAVKVGVKRMYVQETWAAAAKAEIAAAAEKLGLPAPEVIGLPFGKSVEACGLKVMGVPANHSTSRLTGGVSGDLNVDAKKLGGKALADSVMIFENGKETTLSQLTSGIIRSNDILYSRTNWAGKVDLIVLGGTDGAVYYGRAVVTEHTGDSELAPRNIKVEYGGGKSDYVACDTGFAAQTGDYVAVSVKDGRFTSLTKLMELRGVANTAWNGSTAVTVGGRTYRVSADVPCYNKDTGTWMTLSEAHAYASVSNLYVKDGTVRVVEVKHG